MARHSTTHVDIYIDGPAALQGNVYCMVRKDEKGNSHETYPSTFAIALGLARDTAKRAKTRVRKGSRYVYVRYVGPELTDDNDRLREQFPQLNGEELF